MKKQRAAIAALAWVAVSVTGCSTTRLTVDLMAPVLRDTTTAALRSQDPQLVREALPTSILLLQGLLESHPEQSEVARLASMLSFSYAYAFVEDEDPARASTLYRQGIELGWRAFGDPDREQAIRSGDFPSLREALAACDPGDAPALLWIAANWSSWIQLNLADPRAAADLARVLPLVTRLVELDGDAFWGMPHILLGSLHGARPAMLGGDSAASLAEFELAFAASDRTLLMAQVFYARTYCMQVFDGDLYRSSLREVLDAPAGQLPDAELMNAVAREKAARLLPLADEIFD
ncbi:MAG: TRAP transporter TatT component family protein [Gemmatimonadota bacterium]|nr:TRAP transporter TatT component family protein [Gemmatimonadota bacterium]